MRFCCLILSLCMALFAMACKSTLVNTENPSNDIVHSKPQDGAVTEGLVVNMDGTLWHADTYEVLPMGNFYILKGTASDASVFSIMLPDISGKQYHQVLQGGTVSVTYSTDKAQGFLFFAPFAENNGWVKTETVDGFLMGTFEVTVSNGAISKLCKGMFSIKL